MSKPPNWFESARDSDAQEHPVDLKVGRRVDGDPKNKAHLAEIERMERILRDKLSPADHEVLVDFHSQIQAYWLYIIAHYYNVGVDDGRTM